MERQYVTTLVTTQQILSPIWRLPAVSALVTNCQAMDVKGKFPNGLRKIMEEIGIGVSALSRELGTSRQNVQRWQDQSRKIPPDFAAKIAEKFDRTVEEVTFPPGTKGVTQRVRVLSLIKAGTMSKDEVRDADIGSIVVSGLAKGDWIAFKVEGDSMDRISPPDSIIFVNRREKRPVPNACYVVTDAEGNSTYKRFRPDPPRFEPVSTNLNHQPIYPNESLGIVGRVRRTILEM
jgi:SOS-response transcriptional repressor LexA